MCVFLLKNSQNAVLCYNIEYYRPNKDKGKTPELSQISEA